jgi:hypothetical protein
VKSPDWLPAIVKILTSSEVLGFVAALSLIMFLSSVLAIPWLVCRLPEDYLCESGAVDSKCSERLKRRVESVEHAEGWVSPLLKRALRNTLGAVLVVFGVLMLVLPGQGLLTILAGLTLLDFRQKRRLLARLFSRPRVLAVLNSIRRRGGRPLLILPPSSPKSARP